MNKLNLKIKNVQNRRMEVFVDDKKIKMKKNEHGNYYTSIESVNEKVKIRICSAGFELSGKNWFLLYLLYYFVSIFGIFDIRYSKNFYSFDFETEVLIDENTDLELIINNEEDGKKVFVSKTGEFMDGDSNVYVYHEEWKKRRKITQYMKLGGVVAITLICVLFIVL